MKYILLLYKIDYNGLPLEGLITDFVSVLALLPNFYFRKGDWVLGSVSTNFGIFPKFHNFLRSEVFSHWTTREHQLLHLVSGNNNPVPLLFL